MADVGEDVGADVARGDAGEGGDAGGDVDAEPGDAEDVIEDTFDVEELVDAEVGEDEDAPDPCETPEPEGEIVSVDISTGLFVGRPPGFVGGPGEAQSVTSFEAYAQHFGLEREGVPEDEDRLGWALSLFFQNGGEKAMVYPIADDVPSLEELEGMELPPGLLVVPGLSVLEEESERQSAFERLEVFLEREEQGQVFFIGELPRAWGMSEIGAETPAVPLDVYGDRVAMYHPWVQVMGEGQALSVGPAGAVAGVIARTDRSRGEWKAPAGAEAGLVGIEALDQAVGTGEQEVYAAGMVNALRAFGEEPVVWGARTRENPPGEGRYLSVRRLASLMEASVLSGARFAAWEVYEESVWATLKQQVEVFMEGLFREGAFQGATVSQAYFVRVDASTTSVADIARGVARVQIGFAPLRAAEFHILNIEVPVATCLE